MRFNDQDFSQCLVDQRIERALLAQNAGDDIAEERGLGGKILRAFNLAPDPVDFEFGEDVVEARTGDVHLIERLHRSEPRGASLVRLARIVRFGLARHQRPFSSRLSRAMCSAAWAACSPLCP